MKETGFEGGGIVKSNIQRLAQDDAGRPEDTTSTTSDPVKSEKGPG